ncbi:MULTISPECIES: hypothetical protein [Bacillus]|uniref:hypothetical protein n=1 Tax=Bacillus TaxID=1386 RepID=UPI000C76BD7C|nr:MULTISPECIES: hypothetical protein [Bacillus]PLR85749.1 hypothetical protein CVD23_07890 [Bacillus sp. V33-4]RSK53079.1 hypothetical protein EJA13_09385 [Bacillus canaveralius]
MDKQLINEILDSLKAGNMSEYFVKREDFLLFRTVLTDREDFKHFRGIAQRGGDAVFTYQAVPRS